MNVSDFVVRSTPPASPRPPDMSTGPSLIVNAASPRSWSRNVRRGPCPVRCRTAASALRQHVRQGAARGGGRRSAEAEPDQDLGVPARAGEQVPDGGDLHGLADRRGGQVVGGRGEQNALQG